MNVIDLHGYGLKKKEMVNTTGKVLLLTSTSELK